MGAKAIPALLVLGVMAAGWTVVHQINVSDTVDRDAVASSGEPVMSDTLTLPDGKLRVGEFQSVAAREQSVQHLHTVPGRIRYDESRHVDIKASMDGILAEVLVTPGEQVRSGQLLAVLRGPEIGHARAEVLKHETQRQIAQQLLDRERTVSKNLKQFSKMLDERDLIETIETEFKNRSLGSYRQELLATYAQMLLTTDLLDKVKPLASSGSVSGRTIREREADQQIAVAAFTAALDQATFTSSQSRSRAEADVAEADRQLGLAWQSIDALLGYKEPRGSLSLDDEASLSRLEVRAPFAGSVESRRFARNERVTRGDSLIVLANTNSLYVAASIRESDWSAVGLTTGTHVSVNIPALDDRCFDATLHYVGREVDTDTNSVPLVARISNADGLLRPGMFVRVTVPIGEARDALSVRPESVIQHENQQFVFLDLTGGSYKRVDVATGLSSDQWVEITHGLSPGQLVVTSGSFLLKSELLLQGEGESSE